MYDSEKADTSGYMLNIGDRVVLISARYGISSNNPMHGSIEACEGTIISFIGSIMVKWDNGRTNGYAKNTLCFVSRATLSPNIAFKNACPL